MRPSSTGEGWREDLFYRSPAAVGDEKSRSVFRGSGRNRRVLVKHLEAVKLDHILALMPGVGVKLAQSELLETFDRRRRIRIYANRVPRFENLRSQLKR